MMPSTSKKQHNFMAAIANSPSFAKKAGVPTSVGKDFVTADKGKKFSKGGDIMAENKKLSVGKSITDYEDIMNDVAQVEAGICTDPKTGKQVYLGYYPSEELAHNAIVEWQKNKEKL